ncbi:hypothetical protein SAMN02745148_00109 [Modicisalibacter ilicicola DSM 19980]|uniref:Uncharacterized protein n=1 Tax=Modicisalibacter ilicicola DSM 19980 TaxID=1121942 RepID=A0A1M4SGS7_9GAMM|nr:hypothetical protein [Halomonas ilicicola]SHE31433.1 hypothetical protein SAMN02745148_00109 [Halomonas ilicicola DSM 19980]
MNRRHIIGLVSGAMFLAGAAVSAVAAEPASGEITPRIPQVAFMEHHDKLQEWSRGLGVTLPLAEAPMPDVEVTSSSPEPMPRIPQAAVTEHRDKVLEWSRGLGITLHEL